MSDHTPGSELAVTGLHLSPPREGAGPVTHNIMFYKNLFIFIAEK
jgi:hypothetical protein